MKYILQVPSSLDVGGMEKVSRDIGLFADNTKYETHFLVFGEKIGKYENEVINRGCKVIHIQHPSQGYIKFVRNLMKIMKNAQYDVVHAHTMFNIGIIMFIAYMMGVPVRVAHAHSALKNGNSIVKTCYEKVMRFLIRHCATDYIACGDEAGIRLFGQTTYRSKGILIKNGIDTSSFQYSDAIRNTIRNGLGIEDKYVIGHVGHLAPVKNQKYIIRLMPKILTIKKNACLLLLGDGPDRDELRALVEELKLQDYVIMTGNVSNVNEYLSAMDVFAFPSLFEGMPLSIIEVQANGLPCVISDSVPNDVYLTDLVYPVKLDKEDEWIEKICTLKRIDSEKYAAELLNDGYDIMVAMDKIYNIYEKSL